MADAALGGEYEVETAHGKVKLKIPAGTQPNKVFKLSGKGMPILNTDKHGDHMVVTQIAIPTKLTHKQKEALEQFRANTKKKKFW